MFLFAFFKKSNKNLIYNLVRQRIYFQQSCAVKSFVTSMTRHRQIPVDLSYAKFTPDGTASASVPVVILHGMLGSKQNWRGLAKAIAKKTKRDVYCLDARNHGDSPHVPEFSYHEMSADVQHFLKSHGIDTTILIGHSMGGRTAMLLALTQAHLVERLVVVDVSPKNMPKESRLIPEYMSAMKEALDSVESTSLVQARKEVDDYLSKSIPVVAIRQFLLTNLAEEGGKVFWKPNLDALLRQFSNGVTNFPQTTGYYSGETLFICGGDSPFVKCEKTITPPIRGTTIRQTTTEASAKQNKRITPTRQSTVEAKAKELKRITPTRQSTVEAKAKELRRITPTRQSTEEAKAKERRRITPTNQQ